MCRFAWLVLLVSSLFAAPMTVGGQVIRVVVVEQGTHQRVGGGAVILLDEAGEERGGAVADTVGRFVLRAPMAGRYRLRWERVGYGTVLSSDFQVGANEVRELNLNVPVRPFTFQGITAISRRRCESIAAGGETLAQVWEEARKALRATQLAQQTQAVQMDVRLYERKLDRNAERILSEKSREHHGFAGNPWLSPSAEELADSGYVRSVGDERLCHAPDAGVILSQTLLDTHCMRLRDGPDRWIGLAFEPVRDN